MKIKLFLICVLLMLASSGGMSFGQNSSGDDGNTPAGSKSGLLYGQAPRSFAEAALDMIFANNQNQFLDGFIDPEEYIVGPGDKFGISFVYDELKNISCEIRSDGSLFIKSVGQIQIGYLSLSEALELIKEAVSKYYKGSNITIQLIQFRFIKITISGEVIAPGTYYSPATGRVSEVIALAGGLKSDASWRNIKLYGLGQEISVDLVSFNTDGIFEANPLICKGNLIFVPKKSGISGFVTVSGYVNRPSMFEFKANDKLSSIIRYAGGLKGAEDDLEVLVTSISGEEKVHFDAVEIQSTEYQLEPGDNIKVEWKQDHPFISFATVLGEVNHPGRYEFTGESISLADLLKLGGGITGKSNKRMIQVYRQLWDNTIVNARKNSNSDPVQDDNSTFEILSLNQLSLNPRDNNNPADISIINGDSIYVPALTGMISVSGAVVSPGLIKFIEGKNIDYYLNRVGGIGYNADIDGITVITPATNGRIDANNVKVLFDGEIIFVPEKESSRER